MSTFEVDRPEPRGAGAEARSGDGQVDVSVIIPMLNAEGTVPATMDALATQEVPGARWEVVVVDNGSTDGSVEVVERYRDRLPDLRIVDGREHPGIARARNLGAEHARGRFFAFTDADDVVADGWVQQMATAAARGADLVGGTIDYVTLLDGTSPLRPRVEVLDRLPRPLGFLPYALSCNLGVSRRAFERAAGFDAGFARGSDVAFCWSVQLAGFEMEHVPDAVLRYRLRGGLRTLLHQQYTNGRTIPLLYRTYRPHGARRPPLRRVVKRWARIVLRVPIIPLSRRRRWEWLRDVAMEVGRVAGCVRWRTLCL